MSTDAAKKTNPLLATRVFDDERIAKMELDEALEIHELVVKAMSDLEGQPPAVVEALSKNHSLVSKKINDVIGVVSKSDGDIEDEETLKAFVVQTLIFSKDSFDSAQETKDWAKAHDFKSGKVDETGTSYRLRQRDPGDFDSDTFRTITITTGVKAVVGELKSTAKSEDDEDVDVSDESNEEVSKSLYCEFVQKDVELRLVTGILLVPEVVDLQGDIISEEDIRMTAHNFMFDYRAGDNDIAEMHMAKNDQIMLAESWLAPFDMKIEGRDIVKGTWIVTVKVIDDAVWKKVKDGDYTGFSIAGRLPVEDLEEELEEAA